MHRLRTRKNKKVEEDIPPVPSIPNGKFKKGKNQPPPEKPAIDLDSALPSSDDFRTSLLLPNLANRFSILKAEQAAAAMALLSAENEGRTADDSRISYQPAKFMALGDIAETNSITGSSLSGQDPRQTYHSDEQRRPSDDSGIMNRSRGGDGNVLFGGRQKVYRIPASRSFKNGTNSTEDLRSDSPLGTRAVYHNDVPEPTSTSRLKTRLDSEDLGNEEVDTPASEQSDWNKNRFTSSSTNSTNTGNLTRSSTAATSIHSQGSSTIFPTSTSTTSLPISPTTTKPPRRPLYEQALDQQLQDQQNSAMGRLERLASLRRVRTASPPPGSQPPIPGPVSPISRQPQPWPSSRSRSITPSSPLSPPAENGETEEEERDDRKSRVIGKAFPKFEFGLEPRSQTPLSPPVSAAAMEFPTKGLFSPGQLHRDRMRPMSPDLEPEPIPTGTLSERKSSLSLNAVGDGEDKHDAEPDHEMEDSEDRPTFLSSSNPSDDEDGSDMDENDAAMNELDKELDATQDFVDDMANNYARPPNARKSSDVAIAHLLRPTSSESMASETSKIADSDILKSLSPTSPLFDDGSASSDSPTLPPQGLSVLVQKHLRSDSRDSSMYAGSTYTRFSRMSRYGMPPSKVSSIYGLSKPGTLPSGASGSSNGNMWEFDDFDGEGRAAGPPSPKSFLSSASTEDVVPDMHNKSRDHEATMDEDENKNEADWQKVRERTLEQNTPENLADETDEENDRNWEQQLAYRRQLIQQNIRNQEKINSQHEMETPKFPKEPSRSASPSGFGVLRSKTSNGFLKGEGGKAAKMLGMQPDGPVLPRPENKMRGRQGWNPNEEKRLRETVRGPHNVPQRPYPGAPPFGPQRPPRPQVNTSQLSPGSPSGFGPSPNGLSPAGLPHPRHSPGFTPRQTPSREQLSPERRARGQPMGWSDPWGGPGPSAPPSASSSRRPSPVPPRSPARHQPLQPKIDSYNDDLSRAMRTGQSKAAEENATALKEERERNSPDRFEDEVVQSSFDADVPVPTFRRNRGNSKVSEEEALSPRAGPSTRPHPMPLQISSLQKSPSTPELKHSPSSSASSTKNAAAIVKSIEASNAQFVPAKKRSVSKAQIGEPRLLSSTSSVPTVTLPPKSASTSTSPDPSTTRTRRRTNTNTIFGAFKSRSSDEVPPLPTSRSGSTFSDDDVEVKPKKMFGGSKLRKSTSDGGALAARARAQDIAAEEMPSMPPLAPKASDMF